MAGLKQLTKLLRHSGLNRNTWNIALKNIRPLSYVPKQYDGENDPSPYFFDKKVQELLLTLTRTDLQKIFCKRGVGELEDPRYEFLTDEQLKQKMEEIQCKALRLLQFPPAVKVRKPKEKIFSRDPALQGYDTSKYVFTDITFGLKDNERLIVVREPDGTLHEADWSTRDRMNQVYFPRKYRSLKVPALFTKDFLEDILNQGEYIFVLDLACQQFEPDDPEYQKIVSLTFQHINENNEFEKLRSTRHFGSMTFYLVWNKMIDNLLLDVINTGHFVEAKLLIELFNTIHKIKCVKTDDIEVIEDFIKNHSINKAILELALDAAKDVLKQKETLQEGIKKAHGLNN